MATKKMPGMAALGKRRNVHGVRAIASRSVGGGRGPAMQASNKVMPGSATPGKRRIAKGMAATASRSSGSGRGPAMQAARAKRFGPYR